jgi:hypothetical protein
MQSPPHHAVFEKAVATQFADTSKFVAPERPDDDWHELTPGMQKEAAKDPDLYPESAAAVPAASSASLVTGVATASLAAATVAQLDQEVLTKQEAKLPQASLRSTSANGKGTQPEAKPVAPHDVEAQKVMGAYTLAL